MGTCHCCSIKTCLTNVPADYLSIGIAVPVHTRSSTLDTASLVDTLKTSLSHCLACTDGNICIPFKNSSVLGSYIKLTLSDCHKTILFKSTILTWTVLSPSSRPLTTALIDHCASLVPENATAPLSKI